MLRTTVAPEILEWMDEKVEAGEFDSRSEAVEEGVACLQGDRPDGGPAATIDEELAAWVDEHTGPAELFADLSHAANQGLVLLRRKVEREGTHLDVDDELEEDG